MQTSGEGFKQLPGISGDAFRSKAVPAKKDLGPLIIHTQSTSIGGGMDPFSGVLHKDRSFNDLARLSIGA